MKTLLWEGFPATLQLMIMGGGLAVLLAWGLSFVLQRRHPGITFVRMSVASLASLPLFWVGLLMILVLTVHLGWFPAGGYRSIWDAPRHLLIPIWAIGTIGGFSIALEMRSRGDASPLIMLARAAGLVLRHGGMLVSGLILLETVFAIPGIGSRLMVSAFQRDIPVLGASAAVLIWLALWSRLLGNLVLAAVDGNPPTRTAAPRERERGVTLAIGGGVTLGLLVLLFLLPVIATHDPIRNNLLESMTGPGGAHWLGTDFLGRDIFSRVLHGGRSAAAIGLPIAFLVLIVSVPMAAARVALDRANAPALVHGIEGVLEGLVAVPWLVIGILIQVNGEVGWPFVALAVILVPRALRVGWSLGAGERLQIDHIAPVALRMGALFLAATLVMSTALGFLGLGIQPPEPELGVMVATGRSNLSSGWWISFFPGIAISLVAATWLVVATLFSRSGPEYRPVGWVHVMS